MALGNAVLQDQNDDRLMIAFYKIHTKSVWRVGQLPNITAPAAYLSHSSPVATSAARHRRSPGHSCPTRLLPSERQLLCQVGSMKFFLLSRVTLKVKGRGKAGAHEGLVDNNEFMRQLLCQVGPN